MSVLDLSKFKDMMELKAYCEQLTQTNLVLQEQLKISESKRKHLEELMQNKPSVLEVSSNEEEICKIELGRLFFKCKQAPLEYQEAKLVELYTKTLLAIRGKELAEKKNGPAQSTVAKQYTPQELIEIALKSSPEDNEN
jgi:hypothetical protein